MVCPKNDRIFMPATLQSYIDRQVIQKGTYVSFWRMKKTRTPRGYMSDVGSKPKKIRSHGSFSV